MINKKLCSRCVAKYENKLAEKDREIEVLKFSNDSYKTEIWISDQEKTCNGNLEMMILTHDPKYNRQKDISTKLKEESLELQNALKFGDHDSIVDESLDVITVCLNAINKQIKAGVDIKLLIMQHQEKLLNRGWEAERVIKFSIGELQGS